MVGRFSRSVLPGLIANGRSLPWVSQDLRLGFVRTLAADLERGRIRIADDDRDAADDLAHRAAVVTASFVQGRRLEVVLDHPPARLAHDSSSVRPFCPCSRLS